VNQLGEISLQKSRFEYSQSELKEQTIKDSNDFFKEILTELINVEEKYFTLVTSIDAFFNENERSIAITKLKNGGFTSHADEKDDVVLKEYKTNTFSLYTFMATAMFELTNTFVRFPTVIRLLSTSDSIKGLSQQNITIRDDILRSLYINVSELLQNDETISYLSESLYNEFNTLKQLNNNNVRIDIIAYYLRRFINDNHLYDKPNTSTEFNNLIRSFYLVSKKMLDNLKQIYYSTNSARTSQLDAITSKDNGIIKTFHNSTSPVISLIKIRMDGNQYINRRFRISPITKATNSQIMHVEYCDFDYRKGYGEGTKGNHEYAANGFPFYNKEGKETCNGFGAPSGEGDSIIPYNSDMYFGPFSRIYTPDMKNSDIVDDSVFVNSIEGRLRQSKPVCIIGYGASGSGKTSTLVYYKPDNPDLPGQDGILSLLSNRLKDKYKRIKIKVYEFEGNIHTTQPVTDYLIRKYPSEIMTELQSKSGGKLNVYGPKIEYIKRELSPQQENDLLDPTNVNETSFEYELRDVDRKQTWVKSDLGRYNKIPISYEEYQSLSSEKWYDTKSNLYYKLVKDSNVNANGTPILMASELVEFMDTKRSVAATANNPVSSRSHVIIFISYIPVNETEKPADLILCDFAGVENKFDCKNESTLLKLGSIPIKGTDSNGTTDGIPFYENYANQLKIKKYQDYFQTNEASCVELSNFDQNLNTNVKWLLNELRTNPLPVNDVVDPKTKSVLQKGAKTIEREYQKRYPATEMVPPLEFLQRINYLYSVKKLIQDQTQTYSDLLKSFERPRKEVGANKENYPIAIKTAKKFEDLLNSLTPSNSFKTYATNFLEKTPALIRYDQTKNSKEPPVGVLPKTLKDQLLKEIKFKQISIKDDSGINVFTISDLIDVPGTLYPWINTLFSIIPVYGYDLFQPYPDDASRKSALQIMQYAFEYGIIANNKNPTEYMTVSDSLPSFMASVCEDRVKEGLYINKSLEELRYFISSLVMMNSNGKMPPFVDQCAPLQCHPSYQNCFGINPYQSKQGTNEEKSSLAEQIKKVPNSADMTFCVLCVINVSRTSANNPPVSPYINITKLTAEYQRLQMVEHQFFMDKQSMKTLISDILNGQLLTNSLKINKNALDELKNHRLLGPPIDNVVVKKIKTLCEELAKRSVNEPGFMDQFKELIDLVYNLNAITTIGTLEFTDTMAKFGANSVTCTMNYTPITDEQCDVFLKNVNDNGKEVVRLGLEKLVKRKVISDQDMANQLKQFA
jgi:hypothetical protein